MTSVRGGIARLFALALGCAFVSGAAAQASPSTPFCGREATIGALQYLIVCPDWPAIGAVSGSTIFGDKKGQQVFVRTSDPAVTGFLVTMRYRDDAGEHVVAAYAAVDRVYYSGVGWALGEVEILGISVQPKADVGTPLTLGVRVFAPPPLPDVLGLSAPGPDRAHRHGV